MCMLGLLVVWVCLVCMLDVLVIWVSMLGVPVQGRLGVYAGCASGMRVLGVLSVLVIWVCWMCMLGVAVRKSAGCVCWVC